MTVLHKLIVHVKMIIYKTMHFQQSTRSYFYQLMDCVIFQLFPYQEMAFCVFLVFSQL